MGYELPEPQPNSTPQLSLFLLPSLPPKPPGLLTPPLQTMASVPFQWEEAPGKPRSTSPPSSKPKAARSLELPPRLLNEAKITSTPSPKTAMDWSVPDRRRSLTHRLSFTLGRSSLRIPDDNGGSARRQIGKEKRIFNSSRWASFKEHDGGDAEGNFDFSSSIGRSSSARYANNITWTRRRRSFFFFSSSSSSSNNMMKSHFWASIYESVKQAAPWRRKEERLSSRMDVP